MVTLADKSILPFIRPEIFSFLDSLETAILEHHTGNPLQIVAEYLTEEDMSTASPFELMQVIGISYEAGLVLKACVDNDPTSQHYSREYALYIKNIMEAR